MILKFDCMNRKTFASQTMIEILDYDIFHTQEGVRKDYQLCNIVNDDDFVIHHMNTTGEVMCIFTETGNTLKDKMNCRNMRIMCTIS